MKIEFRKGRIAGEYMILYPREEENIFTSGIYLNLPSTFVAAAVELPVSNREALTLLTLVRFNAAIKAKLHKILTEGDQEALEFAIMEIIGEQK